jgi:hypothetical protein
MNRLWDRLLSAVGPSFGSDQHGRRLASTFGLLTNLLKILVALTAIWAIAAGFLQTGRLVSYIPGGFPGHGAAGYWADRANWLGPLLGVPVYTLKAFGVTMLVGLAAALFGGFLGFLFGVPRLSGETAPQPAPSATSGSGTPAPATPPAGISTPSFGAAAPSGQPSAAGAAALRGRRGWQSSTNLTEISDWLTKIIVGVGLVEAKAIYDQLSRLSGSLGTMLFDGAAGSLVVIPAVIIAGTLLGFLYAYLFTQLVVAELVARTDAELSYAGAPSPDQGTILPPDLQTRTQEFSNYIQGLVRQNDKAKLDQIAQALGTATDADITTERSNILAAASDRVGSADAATAATAMTELSRMLHDITERDF